MLIWTTPQVHPTIPSSATCGFHVRLLSQPLSSFSWFICVSVLWPNIYQYAAHTKFLIVISWGNSIAWIGKNIYLPMPFDVLQLFQSFPFSSLYVFAFVLFGLWSVSIILFCFSIKHFHFCISVLVHFSWVSFPSPSPSCLQMVVKEGWLYVVPASTPFGDAALAGGFSWLFHDAPVQILRHYHCYKGRNMEMYSIQISPSSQHAHTPSLWTKEKSQDRKMGRKRHPFAWGTEPWARVLKICPEYWNQT